MGPAALAVAVTIGLLVCAAVAMDLLNKTSRGCHTARYRLRRCTNWLPTALAYALFYCCRYNVAAGNVLSVQEQLHISGTGFALVMTCGYWAYGLSAPLTGMLTDKIGAKAGVLTACAGCAVLNLTLGPCPVD